MAWDLEHWDRTITAATMPMERNTQAFCSARRCSQRATVWVWFGLWCADHGASTMAGHLEDALRERAEEQALARSPV